MKRIVAFVIVALVLTSCEIFDVVSETGNGVPLKTTLEVGEFDVLSLPSMVNVVYTQTSGEQSLTFTCDENLMDYYRIGVEGNTLVVDTKPGIISLTPRVETILTVNSPVLHEVRVSGSGNCSIDGPVTAECGFSLHDTGRGAIHISGQVACASFSVSTSGSGSIDIASITADKIDASTTGSGSIQLICDNVGDINASTSGSGSIHLSGRARSLVTKSTGSGQINWKDLALPE